MQGAELGPTRQGGFRCAGGLASSLEVGEDDRVEPGVQRLDPGEVGVQEFDRADLAAPDSRGQLRGRALEKLVQRYRSSCARALTCT